MTGGTLMSNYLKLNSYKCKNCYKCIRQCPVKAIRLLGNKATIIANECIICGKCYEVCPQDGKSIRTDLKRVRSMVELSPITIASLDPAFYANFNGAGIDAMNYAIKKLGFFRAEEAAIGATIVKNCYEKKIEDSKYDIVISSSCPSVNTLIKKYYPEAVKYLADVVPPMVAHAIDIKTRYPQAKVIFIGPCISKKAEVDVNKKYIDGVITFEELASWLKEENIEVGNISDNINESRARLFPVTGGIVRSMEHSSKKGKSYIIIDGIEKCKTALRDIVSADMHNCFIEMSACEGSCVCGPATIGKNEFVVRKTAAIDCYAGKEDFKVNMPAPELLIRQFKYEGVNRMMPGSKILSDILQRMGKLTPDDELNCGTCGYDTCREKALAVYWGKANPTMCLPYLVGKADSFSDNIISNIPIGIVVLNESFEVQQINESAKVMMNIRSAGEVVGSQVIRILDPQPFISVLKGEKNIKNERVYFAEYKKYVEQTIIYDKNYHIIMGFYTDITEKEKSHEAREKIRNQTIATTDKVIQKQMRIVQEIASLLGETTAETKVALSSLKEALNNE